MGIERETSQQRALELLTGELSSRKHFETLDELLHVLKAGVAFGFPYRVFVTDYVDNKAGHVTAKGDVRILVVVNNLSYKDCSDTGETHKTTGFEITPDVWKKIQERNQETLEKYNQLKDK